LRHAASKD